MLTHTRYAALLALVVAPAGYAQTPAKPLDPGETVSTLVIGRAEPVAADIDAQGHPLPDGPPASPELNLTQDELDQLVADLGSSDYQTRVGATQTLAGLSTEVIEGLVGAYASSDDLEVKLRLRQIVERRFMWEHLLSRHGFLGIQMSIPMLTPDSNMQMAPGMGLVHVKKVLSGGAAKAVGIQVDDLILDLNGQPIPYSRELLDFGRQVSSAGAGGTLRLGILRKGERIEIDVQLNHRAREHYWSQGYWDQLGAAAREFEQYWGTHFPAGLGDVSPPEQPAQEQAKP